MSHSNFFRFQQDISPSTSAVEGGYLSFLPLVHHYHVQNKLGGVCIELDECVLLELKGNVDPLGLRVQLVGEDISFWQLYQFIDTSRIEPDYTLTLSDNRCISFSAQAQEIPLSLHEGKYWAVLIGYKRSAAADLLQEFPTLRSLIERAGAPHATSFWEPDISINHSLRDAWSSLSRPKYFPFRGRGELLLDVCKLLEEYCRQLERQADQQSERSMLGLYHKALAYISDNLLDSINKEKIAEGLGVSTRTLNRAFENRPIKISDYIQQLKLQQACDLLHEGNMTIEQISNLLNYPNRKYFSREFKKYLFVSPSSFQREIEELREQDDDDEE